MEARAGERKLRFRKGFYWAAIPMAVGLVGLNYGPSILWSRLFPVASGSVLLGLVFSIVGGLLLSSLVMVIRRAAPASVARIAMALIVAAPTGALYGMFAFLPSELVPEGSWERMEPPPGRILEVLGPRLMWGGLIVRTDQGTFEKGPFGEPWEVPDPTGGPTTSGFVQSWYPLPPLPGKVARLYRQRLWGEDATIHANYIVLEDGSLWEWTRVSETIGTLMRGMATILFGALAGGLAAVCRASRESPTSRVEPAT